MSAEAALADLGIALPAVPAPAGAYVPALISGSFVYTVGEDGKVHVTPVTVARANGSNTALAGGIEAGAHVVTEGQVQLVDSLGEARAHEEGLEGVLELAGQAG